MTAGRTFLSLPWWWIEWAQTCREILDISCFFETILYEVVLKKRMLSNCFTEITPPSLDPSHSMTFCHFLKIDSMMTSKIPWIQEEDPFKIIMKQSNISLDKKIFKIYNQNNGKLKHSSHVAGIGLTRPSKEILLRESFTTKHWKSILPQELIL